MASHLVRWVELVTKPIRKMESARLPALSVSLMAAILSSCVPSPPLIGLVAETDQQISSAPPSRADDICAIYHPMFPASVIRPVASIYGDPRISTRTEDGGVTPAEVRAIRAAVIAATGGEESRWARISEDLLAQAFESWQPEPLANCDWAGFAREVSAPARHGQIGQVLIADESGSYTRISVPFFIDRDTAIVLVREVDDHRALVIRKLVLTYRDGDQWSMLPHTFEERSASSQ